jgi:glycosyltransferase involved in cell wall biosynthesis
MKINHGKEAKKIALVISTMQAGGGERVVATLSKEFAKHHEVTIIIFDDKRIDYEYGGKLLCIDCPDKQDTIAKAKNLLIRARKLRWLYHREQFDYIFGFMESANYPSVLASRKTIASLHIDPAFLSLLERFLLKLIYPWARQVAPVSEDIASLLRSKYRLKNVRTIYNPVPVNELKQLADRPRPQDRQYILAVGRLTYQKHFDLLIDAYNISRAKHDCDLIILGEGELREELEAQIRKLGLEEKVKIPGRLNDPFHYFKHAEFMALSSRAEGFPMVLIEALTLSCPVLSVDCPTGPREIIRHRGNGLLIEMENQSLLTDSIDELFYDETLRKKLSDNAAESVAHLSAENICQQWLKVADIQQ